MRLKTIGFALILAAALTGTSGAAPGYDARKLMSDGEVYVVALHDTYEDAAHRTGSAGKGTLAAFFKDRIIEIEAGGELFPAHPSVYPCTDKAEDEELNEAYAEAYAVATSEAADAEPYLVARVQVAYEEWLVTMNANPNDPNADALQENFERRLDALTAPDVISQVPDGGSSRA